MNLDNLLILTVLPSTPSSYTSSIQQNSNSSIGSTSMNPNVVIGVAIGGGIGLIAAVGIAWIVRKRARKIKSQQELESATAGPTELVIVHNPSQNGRVSAWRITPTPTHKTSFNEFQKRQVFCFEGRVGNCPSFTRAPRILINY